MKTCQSCHMQSLSATVTNVLDGSCDPAGTEACMESGTVGEASLALDPNKTDSHRLSVQELLTSHPNTAFKLL